MLLVPFRPVEQARDRLAGGCGTCGSRCCAWGNRRSGSGGLRSAGDGAHGLTVVLRGCWVPFGGKSSGNIAGTVPVKLAPASGHIVLPVVARWAARTGGRPEFPHVMSPLTSAQPAAAGGGGRQKLPCCGVWQCAWRISSSHKVFGIKSQTGIASQNLREYRQHPPPELTRRVA